MTDVSWVIDSAASDHLLKDANILSTTEPVNVTVNLATSGASAKCGQMGNVSLRVKNTKGKRTSAFSMKDVLVVPELRKNLLSMHQLVNEGYEMFVTKQGIRFYSSGTKVQGDEKAWAPHVGSRFILSSWVDSKLEANTASAATCT